MTGRLLAALRVLADEWTYSSVRETNLNKCARRRVQLKQLCGDSQAAARGSQCSKTDDREGEGGRERPQREQEKLKKKSMRQGDSSGGHWVGRLLIWANTCS